LDLFAEEYSSMTITGKTRTREACGVDFLLSRPMQKGWTLFPEESTLYWLGNSALSAILL
jgi:hypothetical protein